MDTETQKLKCSECDWTGTMAEAVPADQGFTCPKCGKGRVIVERVDPVDVHDVDGAENLEFRLGARLRGWYLSRKYLRNDVLPLGWEDKTYSFRVYQFRVHFVMPPKLEFSGGIISYSDGERRLGVFRFPRSPDGTFTTPTTLSRKQLADTVKNLKPADVEALMRAPGPLTFNAFRIPSHNFDYFDVSETDVQEIEKITNKEFSAKLKADHVAQIAKLLDAIKFKVENAPDYLLILQNVLDQNWKNLQEVATATDEIIHI